MPRQLYTRLLYENNFEKESDVRGFRMEGDGRVAFLDGKMRLESARDPEEGQRSNFVFWCPEHFPSDLYVTWDFRPIREPGLCMLFFAAAGASGEDLFDPALRTRAGEYAHYHSGDINALHVSYFRRRYPEERAFHTCNLRKSRGAHLVCQGADPIPDAADADGAYRIGLLKHGHEVSFFINDLPIFRWSDDGETYGPVLGGGKIGFRQMAPLVGEYANFKVYTKPEE